MADWCRVRSRAPRMGHEYGKITIAGATPAYALARIVLDTLDYGSSW